MTRAFEAGGVVGVEHRNLDPRDRLAVIVFAVDQMHGGATGPVAGGEHRLMHAAAVHAPPAMARQKRRMDVEDPICEPRQCDGTEFSQVAGQDHQLDAGLGQGVGEGFVRGFGGPGGRDDPRRETVVDGKAQRWGLRAVADHEPRLGGQLARLDSRDDGAHAAAAVGGEKPELHQQASIQNLKLDPQSVVPGFDPGRQVSAQGRVVHVDVHVGEDGAPRAIAFDPAQRLVQMSVGRMRRPPQGVHDPDVEALEGLVRVRRQIDHVAGIRKPAKAIADGPDAAVVLIEGSAREWRRRVPRRSRPRHGGGISRGVAIGGYIPSPSNT